MQGRLNILLYHRVLDEPDPLSPYELHIQRFDNQMKWVNRFFNVLDLAEAIDKLQSNRLPPRALCITFDDGYRDNHKNALPILEKYGLTATFFIATGFLNNGIMWNDLVIESLRKTKLEKIDLNDFGLACFDIQDNKVECLKNIINELKYLSFDERTQVVTEIPRILGVSRPDNLMMTEDEVKLLHHRGMGIGGHTVNHPILSKVDAQQACKELEDGKKALEQLISGEISLFAYPNGKPEQDYQQEHVDMVKQAGFSAAVSTAWGVATKMSDVYQLPRFTPWDHSITKYLVRLGKMRYSNTEVRV